MRLHSFSSNRNNEKYYFVIFYKSVNRILYNTRTICFVPIFNKKNSNNPCALSAVRSRSDYTLVKYHRWHRISCTTLHQHTAECSANHRCDNIVKSSGIRSGFWRAKKIFRIPPRSSLNLFNCRFLFFFAYVW